MTSISFEKIVEDFFDLELHNDFESSKNLIEDTICKNKEMAHTNTLIAQSIKSDYIDFDFDTAEKYLQEALKDNEQNYLVLTCLGLHYANAYNLSLALECLKKAVVASPDNDYPKIWLSKLLYDSNNANEAIATLDEIETTSPFYLKALTRKARLLYRINDYEGSLRLIDIILTHEDDLYTLTTKALLLFRTSKYAESFTTCDYILSLHKTSYEILILKAINEHKLEQNEAVKKTIISIESIEYDHPEVDYIKALTFRYFGKYKKSLRYIEKSLSIRPNSITYLLEKAYTLSLADKSTNVDDIIKDIDPKNIPIFSIWQYNILTKKEQQPLERTDDSDKQKGLRNLVNTVRYTSSINSSELLEEIKLGKKRRQDFLAPENKTPKQNSILFVLRRWNSYTPIIPDNYGNNALGGGYFILHDGIGVVIDPGYDFIKNFSQSGGLFNDIHAIIVTHAHDDHTANLEPLLTLLYKYNQNSDPKKQIELYLTPSVIMKHPGLLKIQAGFYQLFSLQKNCTYNICSNKNITLKALPAYHNDVTSSDFAVGLFFTFTFDDGTTKRICMTSDTGLFPSKSSTTGSPLADSNKNEVWELYPPDTHNPDVLICHLGSIQSYEITPPEDGVVDLDSSFYPNHLGLLGVTRIIQQLKPNLAILSEFGEELICVRKEIYDILKNIFNKDSCNNIIISDTGFAYDIKNAGIYCISKGYFIPAKHIIPVEIGTDIWNFDENCRKTRRHDSFTKYQRMTPEDRRKVWTAQFHPNIHE